MSDKTYVLSLSADTFNAFKMDFDSALQRLLQKMDRLQSDSASINCKISVALTPAPERNFDTTREGDTVQVMKPSFSHEISTEIKVKDKTTGNLSGNRKLVWDEGHRRWADLAFRHGPEPPECCAPCGAGTAPAPGRHRGC